MRKAAEELESLLRDAILDGLPGCVIRGVYRTPTLEVVNRWVDVEALLRTVSTIANAADIIADGISEREITIPPGTVIVAMDHTPYELVAALHDRLGASHISRLYPESSKYEPPDLPDLPAGTAVVLVTDIVLSSNTVRAAISDLIKWHKNPIAVVTIVDARPHNKPLLDILYRHIPLIGCTSVDIRETPEPDRHRIENIDPVLRRPLKSPAKAIVDPHPITSKQLLGWCTGVNDCLYMGHIDRFVGRHYTGYIDTRALLGLESRGRKELIGQFTRTISRDHGGLTESSVELELWYAGNETDPACSLATAIAGALAESNPEDALPRVVSIPRSVGAERFEFPSQVAALDPPRHVVIVDWNCVTGRTLEQMVRLAAAGGAAAVSAIALVSQLAPEDEAWLSEIRSVSGADVDQAAEDGTAVSKRSVVPVAISFLSVLPLGYYPVAECPLCQLRHDASLLMEDAPTALLRGHAAKRLNELREHDRKSILARKPVDSYEVEVSAQEIAAVMELRQRLRTAASDTGARLAVRDELSLATAPGAAHDIQTAWVRLLATEPSWLRVPPLRFSELRGQVAHVANVVATSHPSAGLRREAISVLRAASKRRFLAALYDLFLSTGGAPELTEELFWAIFTCLRHPHLRTVDGLQHAVESLEQCETMGVLDRTIGRVGASDASQLHTWDYLRRSAQLTQELVRLSALSPQQAWSALKAGYADGLRRNSQLRTKILNTRLGLDTWTAHAPTTPDRWAKMLASVRDCQDFLSHSVLPYLPSLKDVLVSDQYAGSIGGDDLDRFLSLLGPQSHMSIERVADLMAEFVAHPQLVLDPPKREALISEFQWLYEFFLNVGEPADGDAISGAMLMRWLDQCPSNLKTAVERSVQQVRAKLPFVVDSDSTMPSDTLVFCDSSLVEEAIKAAVTAAVNGHGGLPASPQPVIRFDVKCDADSVALELRYSAEANLLELDRLTAALSPFDAELRAHRDTGEEGGCILAITFARWTEDFPVS